MYDTSYCWSCEPQQLFWVGGTNARDPKNFPACQQETAWIYANLRPLRIQPPIELMRMRFAQIWQHAPDRPAPRLTGLAQISVEACGAQLYKYMKLHGMLRYPAGVWYGYEFPVTNAPLRTRRGDHARKRIGSGARTSNRRLQRLTTRRHLPQHMEADVNILFSCHLPSGWSKCLRTSALIQSTSLKSSASIKQAPRVILLQTAKIIMVHLPSTA